MARWIPDASGRVPIRAEVDVQQAGGWTVLSRPRFGPAGRAIAGAFGVPLATTVRLDPLAGAAWAFMDGARTLGEVAALLAEKFPTEPDVPARLGRLAGLLVGKCFLVLR